MEFYLLTGIIDRSLSVNNNSAEIILLANKKMEVNARQFFDLSIKWTEVPVEMTCF